MDGRVALTNVLHKYIHVFPASGDPVKLRWSITKLILTTLGPYAVGHVDSHRRASDGAGLCTEHVGRGTN